MNFIKRYIHNIIDDYISKNIWTILNNKTKEEITNQEKELINNISKEIKHKISKNISFMDTIKQYKCLSMKVTLMYDIDGFEKNSHIELIDLKDFKYFIENIDKFKHLSDSITGIHVRNNFYTSKIKANKTLILLNSLDEKVIHVDSLSKIFQPLLNEINKMPELLI